MTSLRPGRRAIRLLLAVVLGALVALLPLAGAGAAETSSAPATAELSGSLAPHLTSPSGAMVLAGTATSLVPAQPVPGDPKGPTGPKGPKSGAGDVTINFNDVTKKPSSPILVLLGLTLLSLVPAILLTCTSFTKILVVLGLTRNALGLQQIPPNQVLAGLALFLSLFIMSPVLNQVNHDGLQPYLDGSKTQTQAWNDGIEPLRGFMLHQTGDKEIALLTDVAHRAKPEKPDDVALTTLIPAFILSELKQAFIIGFMIFIPFLVIDIVVSAGLMSLGMMMMPPVMVSLPFKLLLFVLVDGWGLIVRSLVQSYTG